MIKTQVFLVAIPTNTTKQCVYRFVTLGSRATICGVKVGSVT